MLSGPWALGLITTGRKGVFSLDKKRQVQEVVTTQCRKEQTLEMPFTVGKGQQVGTYQRRRENNKSTPAHEVVSFLEISNKLLDVTKYLVIQLNYYFVSVLVPGIQFWTL